MNNLCRYKIFILFEMIDLKQHKLFGNFVMYNSIVVNAKYL